MGICASPSLSGNDMYNHSYLYKEKKKKLLHVFRYISNSFLWIYTKLTRFVVLHRPLE